MTNVLVSLLMVAALPTADQRSKAEWTALRDAKFAVPAGQTAFGLLQEMNGLIGSTDPFLRDNVTYEAVAKWIYTDKLLSADEQRALLAQWTANLRDGIGESGTDKSYLRSFSALNLRLSPRATTPRPSCRSPSTTPLSPR
ncbi:MAG: hypothetical protein M3Q55_17780 [Acidobacteriota bacterium]|nr:hypothetical protein [Acidobacteriota bacterium]